MTDNSWLQIGLYLATIILCARPLGVWMAAVYEGRKTFLHRALGWLERLIYRAAGIRPDDPMNWKAYATAVMLLSLLSGIALYGLQCLQGYLPLNPEHMSGVSPDLAFNTAISFVTNTNWQSYNGETTLSYLTQMLGLTVQNFISAGVGMAVLVALIRGLRGKQTDNLGNFWVDLTRGILYILLPLSVVLAMLLVSQGVVQSLNPYQKVRLVEPQHYSMRTTGSNGKMVNTRTVVRHQLLPTGPAASQIAIKQLGTNGGGFFGANSAYPYENPTPLSNWLEMAAILLIPAALCCTFGRMVGDMRQGWAIMAAMLLLLIPLMIGCTAAEHAQNPAVAHLIHHHPGWALKNHGYMEGKETRFGITDSAIWTTVTTAASNGSVNSMLDSYSAIGGLIPMWLLQLGEVVFGGVGSGLYGMIMFVIVTVFIAGLMVGRTPEYLGKKIEAFEIKMAAICVLVPPALLLTATAVACVLPGVTNALGNTGPHGFSEILYWASSTANNNGSAFAGLGTNSVFYNIVGGVLMWVGRFWIIIPTLALAGSLAKKKIIPPSSGTLPTHNGMFTCLLAATVVLVGALTFFPALALGPIVEFLSGGRL